jgi:Tfp pilus assembly protein PilV
MKNNKGFALLEGLLILVVVGILGFTGWYVWSAKNKTNSTYNSTGNSSAAKYTKKSTPVTPDPTADWTSYSSKEGQFSLKYPKTWITAAQPDQCSAGILLLGTDSKSVGACGSSNGGQISITSVAGDSQKDSELSSATTGSGNLGFEDIKTSSVTVNDIKGEKQIGTASGMEVQGPPGLPKGTKVTKYIFFNNGRTYVATYTSGNYSGNAYKDALSDFDLMITKTLKFSAS